MHAGTIYRPRDAWQTNNSKYGALYGTDQEEHLGYYWINLFLLLLCIQGDVGPNFHRVKEWCCLSHAEVTRDFQFHDFFPTQSLWILAVTKGCLAPFTTMSSSLRKLRIIAMPLTQPNVSNRILSQTNLAKPSRLVYYQFQITTPVQLSSARLENGEQNSTSSEKKGWLPKEGIAKWATNKVADIWAGFGKQKSGWKVCSIHRLQCDDGWVLSHTSWEYIGLESGWWIVWNLKN